MKNLNLNYEGFEKYLVERTDTSTRVCLRKYPGVHYVFRFENNYGASIVKHLGNYGYDADLWGLAVIQFGKYKELKELLDVIESDDEDDEDDVYILTYNTPITDDIVGYLTDEDVRNLLARIKEL